MLVLSCDDVPANPLPVTGAHADIDVGVVTFATVSDGTTVDNPRWARAEANRLEVAAVGQVEAWVQQPAPETGTVAAGYRKITNRCKDFRHKQARELVARYDLFVVEDLKLQTCCFGPNRNRTRIIPGSSSRMGPGHQRCWLGPVHLDTARQSGRRWTQLG